MYDKESWEGEVGFRAKNRAVVWVSGEAGTAAC